MALMRELTQSQTIRMEMFCLHVGHTGMTDEVSRAEP